MPKRLFSVGLLTPGFALTLSRAQVQGGSFRQMPDGATC